MWEKFPNGHQDFLRSLGSTLDREGASSFSLDEVPEGVAISYLRPDSGNSLRTEKVHTILHDREIHSILEAAQRRRDEGQPASP
jgi:hypothetical protein